MVGYATKHSVYKMLTAERLLVSCAVRPLVYSLFNASRLHGQGCYNVWKPRFVLAMLEKVRRSFVWVTEGPKFRGLNV